MLTAPCKPGLAWEFIGNFTTSMRDYYIWRFQGSDYRAYRYHSCIVKPIGSTALSARVDTHRSLTSQHLCHGTIMLENVSWRA